MPPGFSLESLAGAPARLSKENPGGMGRELFAGFRQLAGSAENGALSIPGLGDPVPTDELEKVTP